MDNNVTLESEQNNYHEIGYHFVNQKTTWWVRFNEKTGKIIEINVSEITTANDFEQIFQTENTMVDDIMKRKISIKKCSVFWDDSVKNWEIAEKTNTLVLDYTEKNKIVSIPQIDSTQVVDMAVAIYKDVGILRLTPDLKSLKKSMNLADINEIKKHDGVLLNIYITHKNNPDRLIDTLSINPLDIFKNPYLDIDISPVTRYIDYDNIGLYTRPIFKTYGLVLYNSGSDTLNDKTFKFMKLAKDNGADLLITRTETGISIRNNIENTSLLQHLKELRFLVCDQYPDNVYGGFTVPAKMFMDPQNNEIAVDTTFDWPKDPVIFYKGPLGVKFLGDKVND